MDGRDIVCIMPTGALLVLDGCLLRNNFQVAVNRSHINCLHSSRQDVLWLSRRLFL
jgi:hypothetical protein